MTAKDLETRLNNLTTFETDLEFSRITDEVLEKYKPDDKLYTLLGIATIKRRFEKVSRNEGSIKIQILKQYKRYRDKLNISHSFTFDENNYSLKNPEQINFLLRSLDTDLTYVLEDYGAFIGKIRDKKVDGIKYKEVDEVCSSGGFQTPACYITKTGNMVKKGEIYVLKNNFKECESDIGRYVFASWSDGTSRELLRKYYGIKSEKEFNSNKKIEDDLILLTIYHELGHHYSMEYFKENMGNLIDFRINIGNFYYEWGGFLNELAADYFENNSNIGMINKLKKKRAKQLLALSTIQQNERKKMRFERPRYEDAFRVNIPYLLNILDSKNFSSELSRFVKAQNIYIKEIIEHAKTIPEFDKKVHYIAQKSNNYKSEFKRIYDNTKPNKEVFY